MRTYRGNRIDGCDERKVRNSIGEEHLPQPALTTSTTGEHDPQAGDSHDEDNKVKGHRCSGFIREGCLMSKNGRTVHVECIEDGRGCASDGTLAQLGSPFCLDLEGRDGQTDGCEGAVGTYRSDT